LRITRQLRANAHKTIQRENRIATCLGSGLSRAWAYSGFSHLGGLRRQVRGALLQSVCGARTGRGAQPRLKGGHFHAPCRILARLALVCENVKASRGHLLLLPNKRPPPPTAPAPASPAKATPATPTAPAMSRPRSIGRAVKPTCLALLLRASSPEHRLGRLRSRQHPFRRPTAYHLGPVPRTGDGGRCRLRARTTTGCFPGPHRYP